METEQEKMIRHLRRETFNEVLSSYRGWLTEKAILIERYKVMHRDRINKVKKSALRSKEALAVNREADQTGEEYMTLRLKEVGWTPEELTAAATAISLK